MPLLRLGIVKLFPENLSLDPPSALRTALLLLLCPLSLQLTSDPVEPGGRTQEKEMLSDVIITASPAMTGSSGGGTKWKSRR